MKKLISSVNGKRVLLFIVLLLSCYSTFYATYLMFPFVTFEGRGILTFLPTVLLYYYPIYTFVFLFAYVHRKNKASKWVALFYYSVSAGIINLLLFIWHIISISLTLGWKIYHGITPLYPFDTLAFLFIAFIICLVVFIHCIKNRSDRLIESDQEEILTNKQIVGYSWYIGTSAYFVGGAFSLFHLIGDGCFDPDFIFIIPVFLLFLTPMMCFVFFTFYKHAKEEKKKKIHLIGNIICLSVYVALSIWIVLGYIVSPYYVPHSISGLFPFGYAAKTPAGFFVIALLVIIPLVVSFVKYAKRYCKKNEQKQEEI